MKASFSNFAIDRMPEPDVKWLQNSDEVNRIIELAAKRYAELFYFKSRKPSMDFNSNYIWDNVSQEPMVYYNFSLWELIKKEIWLRRKEKIRDDFLLADFKFELDGAIRKFKIFLRGNTLDDFSLFISVIKKINLGENFLAFFNKNISHNLFYTISGGLEKKFFMVTIADRLVYIKNGILILNEFALTTKNKNDKHIIIPRQRIKDINEIF